MTPAAFERKLTWDLQKLKERASKAVERTARKAITVVAKNAPKAFGELVDSIHATDNTTFVAAPHAEAVEMGSRPHMVPLEALVRWVKLRGMQGLSSTGKVRSIRWSAAGMGSTTASAARNVARSLKAMRGQETSSSIDDPVKLAKRIQAGIMKNGTKPTRFVMRSLPEVMSVLDSEMKKAFK